MSRILMVTHGSGGDIIPFVRLAEIPGTKEMTKLRGIAMPALAGL